MEEKKSALLENGDGCQVPSVMTHPSTSTMVVVIGLESKIQVFACKYTSKGLDRPEGASFQPSEFEMVYLNCAYCLDHSSLAKCNIMAGRRLGRRRRRNPQLKLCSTEQSRLLVKG